MFLIILRRGLGGEATLVLNCGDEEGRRRRGRGERVCGLGEMVTLLLSY